MEYIEKRYQELQILAKSRGMKASGLNKKDLAFSLEAYDKAVENISKDKPQPENSEDDFIEMEESTSPTEKEIAALPKVEPKVFRADSSERVSEVSIVGGAPPAMLVNDYLTTRGLTFRDLENAVALYAAEHTPDRNITVDSLRITISEGEKKARSIAKSDNSEVDVTDIHVADALRRLGWQTTNTSRRGQSTSVHTMKRP